MKKKGFLIILASCAVVAVVIMLSLNFYSNRKISYYTKNEAFSNQWGLYNCGQEIEGQKGTRGVDIDIIYVFKKRCEIREITGVYLCRAERLAAEFCLPLLCYRNRQPTERRLSVGT